jgi:hypothetical protein
MVIIEIVITGSTVTVESLLVRLFQMLFDLSSLVPSTPQVGGVNDRTFDPLRMISHLFQEMASGSDGCRQTLCKVIYCRFQLTWNIQLGKKNLRLYLDKLYNKPHQGLWSTCGVVVCS